MEMTAAVLREVNQPLRLETVDVEPPRRREVLVRLRAAGICHSDLHYVEGHITRKLPLLLGHEGAGEVVEVGEDVSHVAPGDRVVLAFLPSCMTCPSCLAGRPVFCDVSARLREGTMPDGTNRIFDADGVPVDTLLFIGAFAEYAVVPAASVIVVPHGLEAEQASLLGCGFTTGFAATTSPGTIQVGDRVLVIGCGGVGLAAVRGARLSGASTVVAADVRPDALAEAEALGATQLVDSSDVDRAVTEILRAVPAGVDAAFEAVGGPAATATIDLACRAVRRGGTVHLLGLAPDTVAELPVSPLHLVTQGKTLKGRLFGDAHLRGGLPRILDLVASGRVDLARFVGEVVPFTDVSDAVERMKGGGTSRRTILTFD